MKYMYIPVCITYVYIYIHTVINYITSRYITLHYITSHYTELHQYIHALHYITFTFTSTFTSTFTCIALHYIILHCISTSHHSTSHHITSHHIPTYTAPPIHMHNCMYPKSIPSLVAQAKCHRWSRPDSIRHQSSV